MAETKITLQISSTDGENSSSTTIQTDSLGELRRMLDLAGVPGNGAEVTEQETYKPSADLQVRSPDQRTTNARFADNPMLEDFAEPELELNNVDPKYILDTFRDFSAISDTEEAIARTADTFGITGEEVERVVQNALAYESYDVVSEDFADYNDAGPKEAPPAAKSFKDYVSDLGAEREIKHNEKAFLVKLEWLDANYDSKFAELTIKAGTAKEAQQKAVEQAKAANGGKLNLVDAEVEETVAEAELTEGPIDNRDMTPALQHVLKQVDDIINSYGRGMTSDEVFADLEELDGDQGFKDTIFEYSETIQAYINKQLSIDEAFGVDHNRRTGSYTQKRGYEHTLALLPCPGMWNVDQLGENEYFGNDLQKGSASVVCISIDTGAKPRLTFAITSGGVSDYRPGQNVLTYHDQTGKERPGTIVAAFTGKEWSTPEGREQVKSAMAKGGMDPNKKYSVRVFK